MNDTSARAIITEPLTLDLPGLIASGTLRAGTRGRRQGRGPMDRFVCGAGTLASDKPVKTVGSYWPNGGGFIGDARPDAP